MLLQRTHWWFRSAFVEISTPTFSCKDIYLFTFLAECLLRSRISRDFLWLICGLICWVLKALVDSFRLLSVERHTHSLPVPRTDYTNSIGARSTTKARGHHYSTEGLDEPQSTEDHPHFATQLLPLTQQYLFLNCCQLAGHIYDSFEDTFSLVSKKLCTHLVFCHFLY